MVKLQLYPILKDKDLQKRLLRKIVRKDLQITLYELICIYGTYN